MDAGAGDLRVALGVLLLAKISGHDMSRMWVFSFRAEFDGSHDLRDHQLVGEIAVIFLGLE